MKKVSLVLASVAGVAGLAMLGMSIFQNFPSRLAFITQSLRGPNREVSMYRPGAGEGNGGPSQTICGNSVLEGLEQCEVGIECGDENQLCDSCRCSYPVGRVPTANGNSNGGAIGSKLSCRTLYTVHSWAPAKLDIHIQPYQNGFPVGLPVGWIYGEVANVWLNGSNDIQTVWIGANGIGTKEKMAVGLYTAASYIKHPDGSQLPCANANFEVKQNPAQFCGDGEVQIRNNEQCEVSVPGACDNGGTCGDDCQCNNPNNSCGNNVIDGNEECDVPFGQGYSFCKECKIVGGEIWSFDIDTQGDYSTNDFEFKIQPRQDVVVNFDLFKDVSKISDQYCQGRYFSDSQPYTTTVLNESTTSEKFLAGSCPTVYPFQNNTFVGQGNQNPFVKKLRDDSNGLWNQILSQYSFSYTFDDGRIIQVFAAGNAHTVHYCTDGILQTNEGEQCDDGNEISTDSCGNDCKFN